MEPKALTTLIQDIMTAVEKHVPDYLVVDADRKLNDGNCALCIIDEAGDVYGKMFGTDQVRRRHVFRVSWTKASQVWITGYNTGEYEKLVFTGQVDEKKFGILRPDFVGWIGGQPIVVDDQTKLSIGFSGFRGTSDLEIVQKAVADVMGRKGK
jgi:glc operon protein GlcG